jgi:DNA-binding MarR family transcriptional regulator
METTDAPQRLRALPSWLLSQAALQGHRLVSEGLAADGLRKYHFTVLLALDEQGPTSQAALGRRLSIDRSDMVAVINDLEGKGLLVRSPDPHDRRRNVIALTPAGEQALARLDARVNEAQAALLAALTERERRDLVRLLTRVVETR